MLPHPKNHLEFVTSVKVETNITANNCWKKVGDNTYFYFNEHGQCSNDPSLGYAIVSFRDTGSLSKIYRYQNGQKHSTVGPEFQAFDEDGNLIQEEQLGHPYKRN